MQERLARRARSRARRRAAPASASSTPLSAKKSAGSPPPRQERGASGPTASAAEPVRLGDRRRPLAGEVAGQRTAARAGGRVAAQVDAAGLEQGDALGAAGEVARGDVEQRAEQGRPHRRLVLGERVGEHDRRRPAGRRRGSAAAPASPGSVKLQPTISSKPRSRSASSARRRSRCSRLRPPTRPADRRQRRRQVLVEAVDAADLLDQVDLAGDVVVAVGRHRRPRGPRRRPRRRSRAAPGRRPGRPGRSPSRAGPRPARRAAVSRRGAGISAATSIVPGTSFAPQSSTISREAIRCARMAELRVQLLLEARGGLGAQPEQARGAQDVGPVPVRDLEQDPRRLRRRPRRPGRP